MDTAGRKQNSLRHTPLYNAAMVRCAKILEIAFALLFGTVAPAACAAVAPAQPVEIFRFHTDEFWLNLHHFLYVLGRAQTGTPDSSREAVSGAPADADAGLATLSPAEQKTWRNAVAFYAGGLSKMNLIFDEPLSKLTLALAAVGDSAELRGVTIDPAVAKTLTNAAPAYRRAWWPAHHASNESRRDELRKLTAEHGKDLLAYITRAYEMQWDQNGYPVHFSAYANWAGAYSTGGKLLVVSSLDRDIAGADGLETIFHEGMHQWDDQMIPLLDRIARSLNVRVPRNLSHAMIFFTAGDAVRSVFPDHVPYAEHYGVWKRGWEPLRQALEETWKPYLEGKGTRDDALRALLERCSSIQ